jgi:hypothetical protein
LQKTLKVFREAKPLGSRRLMFSRFGVSSRLVGRAVKFR